MTNDFSIKSREYATGYDQRWQASSHGLDTAKTGTLDLASGFSGVRVNGVIRGGTAVAEITAAGAKKGEYALFDATATDGRQVLAGFVLEDINVSNEDGSLQASGKAPFALLQRGTINRSKLPVVAQRTSITWETPKRGSFVFND